MMRDAHIVVVVVAQWPFFLHIVGPTVDEML